jgi:hypothetical protein
MLAWSVGATSARCCRDSRRRPRALASLRRGRRRTFCCSCRLRGSTTMHRHVRTARYTHATPRHATPRRTPPHATPHTAQRGPLRHPTPPLRHATPRHATRRYAPLRHATPRSLLRHAAPPALHATPPHATPPHTARTARHAAAYRTPRHPALPATPRHATARDVHFRGRVLLGGGLLVSTQVLIHHSTYLSFKNPLANCPAHTVLGMT